MANKYFKDAMKILKNEEPKKIKTERYSDPAFCQAIIDLWNKGYSCTQIGKALKCKRHCIGSWLVRNGYKRKEDKVPRLKEYRNQMTKRLEKDLAKKVK